MCKTRLDTKLPKIRFSTITIPQVCRSSIQPGIRNSKTNSDQSDGNGTIDNEVVQTERRHIQNMGESHREIGQYEQTDKSGKFTSKPNTETITGKMEPKGRKLGGFCDYGERDKVTIKMVVKKGTHTKGVWYH